MFNTDPEPRYATRAEYENRATTWKEGIPIIIGVVVLAAAFIVCGLTLGMHF